MANLEKHVKNPIEQVYEADFNSIPTRSRSPHLIGRYIKNHERQVRGRLSAPDVRPKPFVIRLRDLPATASNVARIRDRVRELNRRLEDSGTPFRLRVIEAA